MKKRQLSYHETERTINYHRGVMKRKCAEVSIELPFLGEVAEISFRSLGGSDARGAKEVWAYSGLSWGYGWLLMLELHTTTPLQRKDNR